MVTGLGLFDDCPQLFDGCDWLAFGDHVLKERTVSTPGEN
jgi:hypothetical protein